MHSEMRSDRKFTFERLESREMLAGDVAAFVDSLGTLHIDGDAAGNVVAVAQQPNGKWKVQGLLGTTINGESVQRFWVDGDIRVNLKGGNDGFALLKGELNGIVYVNTQSGNDGVAIKNLQSWGLRVNTGVNNDALFVYNVEIQSPVTLLPSVVDTAVPSGPYEKVFLNTAGGDDFALVAEVDAALVSVNTNSGNDMAGLVKVCANTLRVNVGSGRDVLGIAKSKATWAAISGGQNPGDYYASAGNAFFSESSDFRVKLNFDAIANQVETLLASTRTYMDILPRIGRIPSIP